MIGIGLTIIIWGFIMGSAVAEYAKKKETKTIQATKHGSAVPRTLQTKGGSRQA